jgi:hypothetical protein
LIGTALVKSFMERLPMRAPKETFRQLLSDNKQGWSISHVLSADCECSDQVLKALLQRKPLVPSEQVLYLGQFSELDQDQLKQLGYQVRSIKAEDIKSPEAFALPSLLIQNPQAQLVYAGGYSDKKVFSVEQVMDTQIFSKLSQGQALAALPIYGCYTQAKWGQWVNSFKVSLKNN